MAGLELVGVEKRFGGTQVLAPTDLAIDPGELIVIVGRSGCGKSTLLRMIAGLEEPTAGTIRIGSRDVTHLPPAERGVAMVFQSYALYPHLTVRQNIAFPLSVAKRPREEIARRVAGVAAMLDLTDLLDRRPRQLSGGQRQRVSIGRAVVREPALLLLDEPLSNLDAGLRVRMRHELARLHQRLGATMVYVTHDQLEAMTLANRIVVMANGRVEQVGTPQQLYGAPATLEVARAIGSPAMNFVAATIVSAWPEGTVVETDNGARCATRSLADPAMAGARVTLGIRPEHLVADPAGRFCGEVELFERLGPLSFAHLNAGEGREPIVAQLAGDAQVTLGERLCFAVAPRHAHLFDADGRALPALTP